MRRRLALLVSATMAMVLCAFVVPLAFYVRALAADHALDQANEEAKELSAVVITTADKNALRTALLILIKTGEHPATVFMPDGRQVGFPAKVTAKVRLAEGGTSSFTALAPGGIDVLDSAQNGGNTYVIQTFASESDLNTGVTRAWFILTGFAIVVLGLGVLVADRLLTGVTQPIAELAQVSQRLASGDLDARTVRVGPSEVREVAHSLNYLAERIRDLIQKERESVADLQHRLRTPLTALRLEAEAVAESGDPDGRLAAQVDALEHAVTALIEDARKRSDGPGSCDAAKVVCERAAFWLVLAEDQGRLMDSDLWTDPVLVGTAESDLAACLDALLGNVFAHTPEGSRFAIRLRPRPGGGAVVVVEDTGPGFGASDPVRRGASGGGSTGLGLDIARQTAESTGGALTVRNTETGGQVIIELGPPQAVTATALR